MRSSLHQRPQIGPARPRARIRAHERNQARDHLGIGRRTLEGARGRRRRRPRHPQRRGDRRPRQPGQGRRRQPGRPRPLRHRHRGAQGCQEARHRLARRAQARLARGQVGRPFQDRHERHPFSDRAGAARHRRRDEIQDRDPRSRHPGRRGGCPGRRRDRHPADQRAAPGRRRRDRRPAAGGAAEDHDLLRRRAGGGEGARRCRGAGEIPGRRGDRDCSRRRAWSRRSKHSPGPPSSFEPPAGPPINVRGRTSCGRKLPPRLHCRHRARRQRRERRRDRPFSARPRCGSRCTS